MIDMLKERVRMMEGGKRRVGRPRKHYRTRGRGIDGYELSEMHTMDGSGIVGGRRHVGRPRKGVIPPQFMARIAALKAKKHRRKRGHGLVGGATAQDIYEDFASKGEEVPKEILALLKAGVKPLTRKELLIKKIQRIEAQIGLTKTSTESLKKYKINSLEKIYNIYNANKEVLAYPPYGNDNRDIYDDEDRFVDKYAYYPLGNEGLVVANVENDPNAGV